jgi:hypothetical protein
MDREPTESAGIDETDLAAIGERENCMRVRGQRHFGLRNEQAAGHSEVDEELSRS